MTTGKYIYVVVEQDDLSDFIQAAFEDPEEAKKFLNRRKEERPSKGYYAERVRLY